MTPRKPFVLRPAGSALVPLLLALSSACSLSTSSIDPLEEQPKYRAFTANPFFDDGRAMRTPPAGTIPREKIVERPEYTTGKDASGAELTSIPVPVTREIMATGRKQFEIRCAICHGLLGDGVSLVGAKMSLRPPPLLVPKPHLPGHVFSVITGGYGLMGSYAAELTVEERWAVVAYLQALNRSQSARLADAPADVRALLEREKAP
jgi:mono/diheme cytochrome c family protein